MNIQLRPYQLDCKKAIKESYDKGIKEQLIVMATGCHAKDTEILMYDGSIKYVQDIVIGDQLMGDDSTPRKVLSLYRGNQAMVKIIPNKGDSFIVNEDHILSLKKTNTPGKYPGMPLVVNISIKDYIKTNRHFKHLYKLYRTGVDFSRNFYDEFKYITPYFLGLWIGDGSSSRPMIVSNEDEVDDYFYSEFKKYCTNRYHKGNELYAYYFGTGNGKFEHNPLWNELTYFIKNGSKYLTTKSVAFRFVDRCELLAGLIDSDGSLGNGSYDFINKNISISRTVLFLAQSIGLYAVMKKCNKQCTNNGKWGEYYRVQISGNINIIPCKVPRKKASPRLQKKDLLMTGFRIEYLKSDSYYGFELNDNHLYCMGDFTVTHNTGKRLASVELMRHFSRSLFIAHREELIGQAYEEIDKLWPMQVGIIKGPLFEVEKKIVVASVQTLQNRLDRINPELFDYIVIDEAHNYISPSFLKTVRHFRPKLRTAWTATPKRLDGLSLTNIAQKLVFQYRIEDGIKDGWLSNVEAYQIRTQADLSGVKRLAGDFNQGQLSERVDSRSRNALIATKYLQYAKDRQAIAYCVDVKHSYNLRDILREHGVNAETIVGDPQLCPNRRELIHRFKNGDIQVLTNCEVLTEGFDYSDIGCIIMGRPTQSERLYIQAIGRGTRIKSEAFVQKFGSSTCIILDFVDNTGKLSLVNAYELEKDLPIEERMFLPKEHKEKLLELREQRERRIKIQEGNDKKVNLFVLPEVKVWSSEKMLEPATEKQIEWLKSMGVWQEDTEYTKAMASELISAQPAKEWQIRWLAEKKYDVSKGCSLGQYQRVKYALDLKNKYAMEEKDKNNILNRFNNDENK